MYENYECGKILLVILGVQWQHFFKNYNYSYMYDTPA